MWEISAWLSVEDGQYWITDSDPDAGFVLPGPGGAGGLVGAVPGLAIVITGTQFGNVALTVQSGDSDPGLDTGGWDEVVEVSLASGAAGQGLGILSGGQGPGELATLTPAGAGSYRIRVHVRGRDAGTADDVVTGEPAEEHLLQIWPAPPGPEIIRKTTDEHGAGFRAGAETSSGPDPRSPHGRHVMLEVSQPVTATSRANAVLERIYVRSGGCEFEFRIVVDVSGMTPQQEKRARRAVGGYRGATLPESTDPGSLRVVLHFSDGRTAEFAATPTGFRVAGQPYPATRSATTRRVVPRWPRRASGRGHCRRPSRSRSPSTGPRWAYRRPRSPSTGPPSSPRPRASPAGLVKQQWFTPNTPYQPRARHSAR